MTIQAKKHLGQNFLRNPDILAKIVGIDNLSTTHVVEIGPGPGDLTLEIIKTKPKSLTLVELDGDMIPLLYNRFWKDKFQLIQNDVLKVNISNKKSDKNRTLSFDAYRVYWNIPYYITSPIIHHFLYDVDFAPDVMILTMQKEVADRILARDGKHTVLSLACQLVADITKICDINPNNFTPAPKVWSSCLRFDLKNWIDRIRSRKILKFIQLGFIQKRKKLISNLSSQYKEEDVERVFKALKIDDNIRAEDIKLNMWAEIFEQLVHQ